MTDPRLAIVREWLFDALHGDAPLDDEPEFAKLLSALDAHDAKGFGEAMNKLEALLRDMFELIASYEAQWGDEYLASTKWRFPEEHQRLKDEALEMLAELQALTPRRDGALELAKRLLALLGPTKEPAWAAKAEDQAHALVALLGGGK